MPILVELEEDSLESNNNNNNDNNDNDNDNDLINNDLIVGNNNTHNTYSTNHNNNNHNRYMIEDHRTHKDIKTLIVEHNDSMDDLVCSSFPINGRSHNNVHNVHSSFPSVHEIKTDIKIIRRNCWNQWNNVPIKKRRRYMMYTVCIALFVILMCTIPSMKHYHDAKTASSSSSSSTPNTNNNDIIVKNDEVSNNDNNNKIIMNNNSNNSSDIMSSVPRKATYLNVVEYLSSNHVTDMNMMIRTDTYQYQAANWLSNHDGMNLPIPSTGIDTYNGYMYIVRYILALNYFALGGPQWDNSLSFLSAKSICLWNKQQKIYDRNTMSTNTTNNNNNNINDNIKETFFDAGVICSTDSNDHNIDNEPIPQHLYLNANNLLGQIPNENGLLTSFTKFKMEKNLIAGTLPSSLCQLTNLIELSFTNNHLSKTIPSCIGSKLQNLQSISLSRNRFTGTLSSEWNNLKQLENILLSHNMISGDPLPILNELPKLKNILFSGNAFDGVIDTTFLSSLLEDSTNQLQKIDLSDNRFSTNKDIGLPLHLLNHNSSSLAVLDLSKNTLYGTVPSDISMNTKLSYLSLYNNQLSGTIPTQFKNMYGLQHFDLSDNNFDGNIPSEIGAMSHLRFLSFSKNDLLTAGTFPFSFSSLKNLEYLSLRDTNRIGKIPSFIDQYATNLIYLDLSHNQFTGALPLQFYSLSNLQIVMLNNNPKITGVIPVTIGYWKNLHGAFLDGTNLSGSLEAICPLISIAKHEIVYADCHTGGSGRYSNNTSNKPTIECSCCQCCSSLSIGCSESKVTSLDKGLEFVFQMIDYSASIASIMDPDFQALSCIRDGVCY